MLVKALRNGLGRLIVAIDWATRPKGIKRSVEEQAKIEDALKGLSLYQLYACPFCVKTRRALHRLNVPMETRDIGKNTDFRAELENNGGRVMVPCLRIDEGDSVHWMYESKEIIRYLEERVAA